MPCETSSGEPAHAGPGSGAGESGTPDDDAIADATADVVDSLGARERFRNAGIGRLNVEERGFGQLCGASVYRTSRYRDWFLSYRYGIIGAWLTLSSDTPAPRSADDRYPPRIAHKP